MSKAQQSYQQTQQQQQQQHQQQSGGSAASVTSQQQQQQDHQQQQQRALFVKPAPHLPIFAVDRMGFSFAYTPNSQHLMQAIGGWRRISTITLAFYRKMIADTHLSQFLGSSVGPGNSVPLECHAARLAKYIAEMAGQDGGEGRGPWTQDKRSRSREAINLAGGRTQVAYDRSSAHSCAWYSSTRPANLVGRRFKLDDSLMWSRNLMWSCREVLGQDCFAWTPGAPATHFPERGTTEQVFAHYLLCFVAHFLPIYERSATEFVAWTAKWSESPENIAQYVAAGNHHADLVGIDVATARRRCPVEDRISENDLYDGATV